MVIIREGFLTLEQRGQSEQAHTLGSEEWHKMVRTSVSAALAQEARTGQMPPVTVIFMDANHFKSINDTLGHSMGDRVIEDIQAIIGGTLRAVDEEDKSREPDFMSVKPAQGLESKYTAGHIGGDEFAILARTDDAGARALVERLRNVVNEYLEDPKNAQLKDLDINLAIGVAVLQPRMTAATLLEMADWAMYEDKLRQLPQLNEQQQAVLERLFEELEAHNIRWRDLGKYAVLLARQKPELAE